MLSPIILFVYNRPEHTKKTIEALAQNSIACESTLFIYSDAAKTQQHESAVVKVRDFISRVELTHSFKNVHIIERQSNFGLAKSIMEGVTQVINDFGKAIILEDDLVTSEDFLSFMNDSLTFYRDNNSIGSISGYSPIENLPDSYKDSIYLIPRTCSLGWATWSDRWKEVDWEVNDFEEFRVNKKQVNEFNLCGSDRFDRLRRQIEIGINSWSIRFSYWQFSAKKLTVYSSITRILNIGDDGSGVHDSTNAVYNTNFNIKSTPYTLTEPAVNTKIVRLVHKCYSGSMSSRIARYLRNNGFAWLEAKIKYLIKGSLMNFLFHIRK